MVNALTALNNLYSKSYQIKSNKKCRECWLQGTLKKFEKIGKLRQTSRLKEYGAAHLIQLGQDNFKFNSVYTEGLVSTRLGKEWEKSWSYAQVKLDKLLSFLKVSFTQHNCFPAYKKNIILSAKCVLCIDAICLINWIKNTYLTYLLWGFDTTTSCSNYFEV